MKSITIKDINLISENEKCLTFSNRSGVKRFIGIPTSQLIKREESEDLNGCSATTYFVTVFMYRILLRDADVWSSRDILFNAEN